MPKYRLRKKLSDAEVQTTQKIKCCRRTDYEKKLSDAEVHTTQKIK